MSTIVYRISVLLSAILADVPVGTNLGLFWLLWALISGRFLLSRGAVFPALADGDSPQTPCDAPEQPWPMGVGPLRPWCRRGTRWSSRKAGGAPIAMKGAVPWRVTWSASSARTSAAVSAPTTSPRLTQPCRPLPWRWWRRSGLSAKYGSPWCVCSYGLNPGDCHEAALQRRAITQAGATLQPDEVLVVDAGFGVAALLTGGVPRFVARVARNFTARRNVLPAATGRGRRPAYGARVRPLPRTYKGKTIAATPPDATAQWVVAGRRVHAQVWDTLVLSTATPGAVAFRCVVIHDPRYQEPWVLATNLPVSAYALWCLSRDRWPVEHVPLAAKQMLGAHRAFVFGGESRHRLPELALLAGMS